MTMISFWKQCEILYYGHTRDSIYTRNKGWFNTLSIHMNKNCLNDRQYSKMKVHGPKNTWVPQNSDIVPYEKVKKKKSKVQKSIYKHATIYIKENVYIYMIIHT